MGVAEVADVDCFGAIVGELVRAGAADAIGRVCACDLIGMVLLKAPEMALGDRTYQSRLLPCP